MSFKERIKFFKEKSVSEITIISVISISFLSMLFLGLMKTLGEESCNILICMYLDKIFPFLNVFGFIFFLPLVILFYLNLTNPLISLVGFLLTFPYWILLGRAVSWTFGKIFKKNYLVNPKDEKNVNKFTFRLLSYVMILFIFSLGVISFLYYPQIKIEVEFSQYLLLATAGVAISAYILNSYKGKSSEAVELRRKTKKFTEFTIFLLMMGAFTNFMISNSLAIGENIVDLASMNAIQMMFMGGGFLGLMFLLVILMNYKSPKKKNDKKQK